MVALDNESREIENEVNVNENDYNEVDGCHIKPNCNFTVVKI